MTAPCSPAYAPHPDKVSPAGCITLIGMAAAGKTTIGRELSALIGWPQIDADNLIEAHYGVPLQQLADSMDKEAFLDIEGLVLERIKVRRTIISTGGSAVYRQNAIRHVAGLGPVVYIDVPLPVILERIARKPERGLAIAPGQTVEELYRERQRLYEAAAQYTVEGGNAAPKTYARRIAEWLAEGA